MILSPTCPTARVEALQKELKRKFGVVGRRETRETDVLLLRVKRPDAPGLETQCTTGHNGFSSFHDQSDNEFPSGPAQCRMPDFDLYLERTFEIPVVDQTGLAGRYDIDLKWNETRLAATDPTILKQALLDQLGLELVPGNEPIEMLVIEKRRSCRRACLYPGLSVRVCGFER